MLGRVAQLLGRKSLIGALVAVIGIGGGLVWQWQTATQDAATAEQRASEYRSSLEAAERRLSESLEARRALGQALSEKAARERTARERLKRAEDKLRDLEDSDEAVKKWSGQPIPADVVGWLREQ